MIKVNVVVFFIIMQLANCLLANENNDLEANEIIAKLEESSIFKYSDDECAVDVMPDKDSSCAIELRDCSSNKIYECIQSCIDNDAISCQSLAELLDDKGFDKYARILFLKSCRLGIIVGCTNHAVLMNAEINEEMHVDKRVYYDQCAFDTYRKACNLKESWGCAIYGVYLFYGISVKQDIELALNVLIKACNCSEADEVCIYARKLFKQFSLCYKNNTCDEFIRRNTKVLNV